MPAAARMLDATSHGGILIFPVSPNVFINGLPAAFVPTGAVCPSPKPHGSVTTQGSSNVFINNLAAHRVGDGLSCKASTASGSGDTFIGGGTSTSDSSPPPGMA